MAIKAKSVIFVLVVIALTLVVTSLVSDWVRLGANNEPSIKVEAVIRLFNLDSEANIPTFFSVGIIAFSGCLLSFIAQAQRQPNTSDSKYWTALSFIFFAMAFDEFVSIHELFIGTFRNFGGYTAFYFGWVVPGLIGVVVLTIAFSRFILKLETRTRNLFVLSGFIYVGGALFVELIEGLIASRVGEANWTYVAATTTQESMEMLGIIVFMYALLDYIQRHKIITAIFVPAA